MCLYLCKRRHGRVMTPRLKPFEKGTVRKAGVRQKHHLYLSYTRTRITLAHLHFIL